MSRVFRIESAGLRKRPYYHHLTKNVATANISQSLTHIMAGKQLAEIWYEEITSLSPYVHVTSMSLYRVSFAATRRNRLTPDDL